MNSERYMAAFRDIVVNKIKNDSLDQVTVDLYGWLNHSLAQKVMGNVNLEGALQ